MRKYTNLLLEKFDNGEFDARSLIQDLLMWLDEGEVEQFCDHHGYCEEEEEEEPDANLSDYVIKQLEDSERLLNSGEATCEINYNIPYIALEFAGKTFYMQGDEAAAELAEDEERNSNFDTEAWLIWKFFMN